MQKLQLEDSSFLSESILKSLTRNGVSSILEFLQEHAEKISTITKLSLPQVLSLRSNVLQKYSAPLVNAYSLFVDKLCTKTLSTGIDSLDSIIGGLPIGSLTEICGLADSGKTQLCLQIVINLARGATNHILYITTKADFSAVRVQKILHGLGHSYKEMAEIMFRIKVIHVWTMDEMVDLLSSIRNKQLIIENLSLIIVDSLPCLMFQYLGDQHKIGLSLLNIFANHCKYLCKEFGLSIICVNIQTRWVDQDISEPDDEESTSANYSVERRQRSLGRYWQHIPALVLQLEKTDKSQIDLSSHNLCVTVLKSNYGVSHNSCFLSISAAGVS